MMEIDDADSHIPTAATTAGMNQYPQNQPVKRYAF